MEFFAYVILGTVMYIVCKTSEWKVINRTYPSGMKTDWWETSGANIIKDISRRNIYKKRCQGGYDFLDKRTNNKDVWEGFKRKHSHGNWKQ